MAVDRKPPKNQPQASPQSAPPPRSQAGIALLIAVMSVAVMIIFVAEMIVSSTVNVELAIITRDRIRSEYLAKSGANLASYLLSASHLWKQVQASGVLGERKEPTDGPASLWNLMNQLPPLGSASLDFIQASTQTDSENSDPFGLQGFLNEDLAAKMRLFEDIFSVEVQDESARINVNDCAGSAKAQRTCPEVIAQLEALFSCPPEKLFLEDKNLTPRELAFRIRDYISSDENISPESDLGGKDTPYQRANPPYEAKRLPLDSVSELKMIAGWDDEVHAVFSPYLTVFPFDEVGKSRSTTIGKLNINSVPRELFACLIPESIADTCREKSTLEIHQLRKDSVNILEVKKNLGVKLANMFCHRGGSNPDTQLAGWFKLDSDVFRIKVNAETGQQNRKLEIVIRSVDKGTAGEDLEKREVKRAYQILYWKII